MDNLPLVKLDIDNFLTSVEFNKGYRYNEFDSNIDKVAVYGIGGLIAGKILTKLGFFAVLLKFWKIIIIFFVGIFAIFRKRIFRSKNK